MSKGRRQETKKAAEWDLMTNWRHFLCYMHRAGVKKSIKRQMNKRWRQELKQDLKQRSDEP